MAGSSRMSFEDACRRFNTLARRFARPPAPPPQEPGKPGTTQGLKSADMCMPGPDRDARFMDRMARVLDPFLKPMIVGYLRSRNVPADRAEDVLNELLASLFGKMRASRRAPAARESGRKSGPAPVEVEASKPLVIESKSFLKYLIQDATRAVTGRPRTSPLDGLSGAIEDYLEHVRRLPAGDADPTAKILLDAIRTRIRACCTGVLHDLSRGKRPQIGPLTEKELSARSKELAQSILKAFKAGRIWRTPVVSGQPTAASDEGDPPAGTQVSPRLVFAFREDIVDWALGRRPVPDGSSSLPASPPGPPSAALPLPAGAACREMSREAVTRACDDLLHLMQDRDSPLISKMCLRLYLALLMLPYEENENAFRLAYERSPELPYTGGTKDNNKHFWAEKVIDAAQEAGLIGPGSASRKMLIDHTCKAGVFARCFAGLIDFSALETSPEARDVVARLLKEACASYHALWLQAITRPSRKPPWPFDINGVKTVLSAGLDADSRILRVVLLDARAGVPPEGAPPELERREERRT